MIVRSERRPGTTTARKGVSLVVVMGALMVVSIFAFAMSFLTSQSLHRAHRISSQEGAILLARAARNFALSKIYEGLSTTDSRIFNTLTARDLATGTTIPFDTAELNSLAAEYRRGSVGVAVSIDAISALDPAKLAATTGGHDEVERRAILRIDVAANVDGVPYAFLESREIRIFSIVPGVLGKFSLYVRQPDTDYNRFAADINGDPDTRVAVADRRLPLILKNGGELDEGATSANDPGGWKRRGYIYRGGAGPVRLNLTAGNDDRFGESFHFFHVNAEPISIPGYYDPDPPGFFANPPDFSKKYPVTGNTPMPPFAPEFSFWIKHVVSGFYTRDETGADMNVENRLALTFPTPSIPGTPNPRMRSSVLHLYGTRSNPSPTLILGDVRRRYADYAAVLADATGDNARDAILCYLKQTAGPLYNAPVPGNPIRAAAGGGLTVGQAIRLDPDPSLFSCENMFAGDYNMYSDKMCQVFEEPYLRSHDYLYYRTATNFVPQTSDFGSDGYASTQSTFRLEMDTTMNRTEPFFDRGDVAAIPVDCLVSKCPIVVPGGRDFLGRFVDEDNVLTLDTNLLIRGETGRTIAFPPSLQVRKGGIIVIENGNLSLGAINRDRRDPDAFLVVAVLRGDIEIDSSLGNGRIAATLIAPNGKIVNRSPGFALDLTGGLHVKTLDGDTFPAGGRIAFDTRTDPSSVNYKMYYRALVANVATSYREGM